MNCHSSTPTPASYPNTRTHVFSRKIVGALNPPPPRAPPFVTRSTDLSAAYDISQTTAQYEPALDNDKCSHTRLFSEPGSHCSNHGGASVVLPLRGGQCESFFQLSYTPHQSPHLQVRRFGQYIFIVEKYVLVVGQHHTDINAKSNLEVEKVLYARIIEGSLPSPNPSTFAR